MSTNNDDAPRKRGRRPLEGGSSHLSVYLDGPARSALESLRRMLAGSSGRRATDSELVRRALGEMERRLSEAVLDEVFGQVPPEATPSGTSGV